MPLDHHLLKKSRFCLVSDLDWTMVDHHDPTHEKLLEFNRLWLTHLAEDSLLVFSTGRSQELFHELAVCPNSILFTPYVSLRHALQININQYTNASSLQNDVPLLIPDILICSVGTEIYIKGAQDEEWITHLDQGWNRQAIADIAARFPALILQQPSEQRPHKVSYKIHTDSPSNLVSDVKQALLEDGMDVTVIASGGEDLDILPKRASKGKALEFLLQQVSQLDMPLDNDTTADGSCASFSVHEKGRHVMVAGDSGNDIELFMVDGVYGCIVANAHEELKNWYKSEFEEVKEGTTAERKEKMFMATEEGPSGISQALHYFGFAQQDVGNTSISKTMSRRKAVVDLHAWFEHCYNLAVNTRDEISFQHAEDGLNYFEKVMDDEFELVGPEGKILRKGNLIHFFRKVIDAAAAAAATDDDSTNTIGKKRVWIDQYSERELVPGSNLWLIRYMELQQSFIEREKRSAGSGIVSSGQSLCDRTARWSSALMKFDSDTGEETWMYVHETWILREKFYQSG